MSPQPIPEAGNRFSSGQGRLAEILSTARPYSPDTGVPESVGLEAYYAPTVEIAQALVQKAFYDLKVDGVHAQAIIDNVGSQKVMQKTGMKVTERLLYDQTGSVFFAVTQQAYTEHEFGTSSFTSTCRPRSLDQDGPAAAM